MNEAASFFQQEKTSQMLKHFVDSIGDSNVSFAYVVQSFEQRSYAGIFFILAILCFLPGISILAGAVMILPSLQMLLGKKSPTLPKQLARMTISSDRLNHGFDWLMPRLIWLESWVKPRWEIFSSTIAKHIIGFVALLLAIIVAVPFPLSNFLPAAAMLFISIGILERDGLLIALGLIVSFIAFVLSFAVIKILLFWIEALIFN